MFLILLRHGHDMQRTSGEPELSIRGLSEISETMTSYWQQGIKRIDFAACSPALRARQSLEEATRAVSATAEIVTDSLSPGSTENDLTDFILTQPLNDDVNVLLVGHEPQLTRSILSMLGVSEDDRDSAPPLLARGESCSLVVEIRDGFLHAHTADLPHSGKPTISHASKMSLPFSAA